MFLVNIISMFVEWHKRALAEIDLILFQAHERNSEEATNIERAVERTLNTVQMFPKTGRFVRVKDWYEKYVPHTRVVLIYKVKDEELVIIGVFHTSRDPNTKPFQRRLDMS